MARGRANDDLGLSYRWPVSKLQLTVARALCLSITPSLSGRRAIVREGSSLCVAGSAPLCRVLMKSATSTRCRLRHCCYKIEHHCNRRPDKGGQAATELPRKPPIDTSADEYYGAIDSRIRAIHCLYPRTMRRRCEIDPRFV